MARFAYTLLLGVLVSPIILRGQINDCADAVVICNSENIAFNPIGPGFNDFADPDNHAGCMVALEQNSAWYYFEIDPNAPPNLELGFIIDPNGGLGEDYDWALFGPDVHCGDLGFPIRCSSSSAMCGFCPQTGMGMGTMDVTEGPGTGDGFVMTLIVQPGQGFYLLIDNWQGTMNGFELEWTGSAADHLNCAADPPCSLEALAGPDIEACDGETGFQLAGAAHGGDGNEMFSWSGTNGGTAFLSDPNVANPSVTLPPGFTGTIVYTLMVEESDCSGTDEMNLIVHPLPAVAINPEAPLCANDPAETLTGIPGGGVWGGAATGNTFNPMLHGPGFHTITYTYTDVNGCSNTASFDIEVYELPEIMVDPDPATFCDSENSVLLTASGSGGAGNYMFAWNTPTGMDVGPTYDASLSGPHTVVVTDDNGCTNSSTVMVTSYANPDIDIIDPGPVCSTLGVLTIQGTPPGGLFEGSVIDPSGELYPVNITPGTYTISYTYTDNNDCSSTDYLDITIVDPPEIAAENNGPLCGSDTIMLMGETTTPGGTIVYEWAGPGGYTSNLQNPNDATLGGTYTLVVTVDGCASAPISTVVDVFDTPNAVASNDGPYCNGESIQLFGHTDSTGTMLTYTWSGPGGYTSSAQNPDDATQPGVYTLVISNGTCPSIPAQTEVIFGTPPDAMATNDGPYCAGETIHLAGSTTTSGTTIEYLWSGPNGYQSTQQNPDDALQPGTYQLVVVVDGCSSNPAMTNVQVNPAPVPDIMGQDSFCAGFMVTLDAGAGFNSYAWSGGAITQTIDVNSSGLFIVTVSDAIGCTGVDSILVTEIPSLMPTISGGLDFCEGEVTALDAGAGYAGYLWSTNEVTPVINVSTSGNYSVTVTDTDGCTGSAMVTATLHLNPVIMIGGSSTFCIGGYTILDAGDGYINYLWSNDSTSQSIQVNTIGTYSVTVTDQFGCVGTSSVMVDESTSLFPIITGTPAFCENSSTTLNAGSGFATYDWSTGATSQMLNVSSANTYTVTVSDGQGCTGTSAVAVVEVLPPSAQLLPDTVVCNTTGGGSLIDLFGLIIGGDNGGNWVDVDQSGAIGGPANLDFNGVNAGTYRFEYTTNSAVVPCPETTYSVVITVLDCACPDVFIDDPGAICNSGQTLDLSSVVTTTVPGDWSIVQTPPGTNPVILNGSGFTANGHDPGVYSLVFTLQGVQPPGCPSNFDTEVQVDAAVHAGLPVVIDILCAGHEELIQLSTLLFGNDPNGTWTEISNIPSQGGAFNALDGSFLTTGQQAGLYSFAYTVPANGACPADTTIVTVDLAMLPVVVISVPEPLDCANPVQQLDASGSSSGADYSILWLGPGIVSGGNTLQPMIDAPGTYILEIVDDLTGCRQAMMVDVEANTDPPTGALLVIDDPSCFGDADGSISVDDITGGTAPYQFSLNDGPLTSMPDFTQLSAGTFGVEVIDANGCRWDTMLTLVQHDEVTIDLGTDLQINVGDEAIVQAIVNIPANEADTIIWTPDGVVVCMDLVCLDATIQTFNTIVLTATVYDIFGCSASDQIRIEVSKDLRIYVPTAFSPNGDGINDRLQINVDPNQILGIRSFYIYDRWGGLMFGANDFIPNDPAIYWDGASKGKEMNPGVYSWFAEVDVLDGSTRVVAGDVTVIR